MPFLILSYAGMAVAVYAALHDVAVRTVPNTAALLLLLIGVAARLLDHNISGGVIATFCVFAVTFIFWRLGWMGGGDLKLLTASAMFVASAPAAQGVGGMVIATTLAGGVLSLLYLTGSLLAPKPAAVKPKGFIMRVFRAELWRLRRRGPLPYATAIAAGTLYATTLRLHP